MKTKERLLARELRARDGLSIKAIAARLDVSQATVSLWVRDIELTPEQTGPIHAAGCVLYWAEGDKSRNQARMSNSDPHLLRFFVDFLRRYFDIHDDDIRVSCHLFADHVERQAEVEQFWLDRLGLTQRSLRKSFVNVYSLSSKRKRVNMLPYGTCRVGVSRTSVVQSIFGSIQEYGGFDRAEWLD